MLPSAARERATPPRSRRRSSSGSSDSSSNEGDLVLDPFCGCGTAIAVAERLKRRWVGIDVTHLAIGIIRERMKAASFEVHGEPVDLPGAQRLAVDDPSQFQWWLLGLVGARPAARAARKSGAEPVVDGELFFQSSPGGVLDRRVVISVKSGGHGAADVRELRAALAREEACMGVLLTLQKPTAAMKAEAARAGFYPSVRGRHPCIQILTAEQIFGGQRIDCPGANVTAPGTVRRARAGREAIPALLYRASE